MTNPAINRPVTQKWTWDELDANPSNVSVLDAEDLELDHQSTEAMRTRLLGKPARQRDALRQALQQKATSTVCTDKHKGRQRLCLVAAPIVLAYADENAVLTEPALFRDGGAHLPDRWKQLWARLVPGARVIPASSCVLLDEVLGASPHAVRACLQEGAAFVQGGPKPQLRLRRVEPGRKEVRKSVLGPVAATYLAMAYVITGEDEPHLPPTPGALVDAAELLQGLFANRREKPRVQVLTPAPFFEAVRAATAAQLRHFVDWGNDNDPSWALNMIEPDRSTVVEVVGTYGFDAAASEDAEPSVVRWMWDRLWWTDAQVEKLKDVVAAAEYQSSPSFPRSNAVHRQSACLSGLRTGLLH